LFVFVWALDENTSSTSAAPVRKDFNMIEFGIFPELNQMWGVEQTLRVIYY
jgi:hypothetical protein